MFELRPTKKRGMGSRCGSAVVPGSLPSLARVTYQKHGIRGKGRWEASGAHHNSWTRSYLMTDVSCTLHAKPLGVSKMWSIHPSQQFGEWEIRIGKGAGEGREKNIALKTDRLLLALDEDLARLGQHVSIALPRDAAVAAVTLVLLRDLGSGLPDDIFSSKNPSLGKFWKVLQWKRLVFLWPFCLVGGQMVYFMAILNILWSFSTCFPHFGML
jgi:hypothetical protein